MICKHCGRELKDGSKFCAYCGRPQQQTIPETPGAPVGQNGASVFRNKQMLLIIGSIAIGIVLILTALFLILKPGTNRRSDTPEEKTETTEEVVEELSPEQKKEKQELESIYDSLVSRQVDGAFSSEQEIMEDYREAAEEYMGTGDLDAARSVMTKWENLADAIQGYGHYEMSVEQVDVNGYPMVKIYFRIRDSNTGAAVNTLDESGFHIYEKPEGAADFVKRDVIRSTQLNNEENVNICMVADVSGSMNGIPLSEAKWVMGNFLNTIQTEAGDRVSLISFADQVNIQTAFTGDTNLVRNAVNNLVTYDMTALYDALYVAINQTASQEGAKCIIAFTDGKDNISRCSPEIIVQLAQRYSIPVFIIGVGNNLDSGDLNYIASATKGFYKTVGQVNGMAEIYDSIFREQKEMYLVEYETLQQNNKDVIRNLNLDYVDDTLAVRQEYQYVPAVYMEVNTSMAQMFVNDFIIYDSDRRYVTAADLDRLTKDELRLARNEIYARRGRRFRDQQLQSYFDARSWYHGTIAPEAFRESMLNDYERANAYFIADYERLKGYIK